MKSLRFEIVKSVCGLEISSREAAISPFQHLTI